MADPSTRPCFTRVPRSQSSGALNGAGVLALIQNDYALARALLAESRDLYAALDDAGGVASAVSNLGWLAHDCSETSRARALFEESLSTRRAIGDVVGEASSLNNLGMMALERADQRCRSARVVQPQCRPVPVRRQCHRPGAGAEQPGLGRAGAGRIRARHRRCSPKASLWRSAWTMPARSAHNLSNLGLMALYGGHYARPTTASSTPGGVQRLRRPRGVAEGAGKRGRASAGVRAGRSTRRDCSGRGGTARDDRCAAAPGRPLALRRRLAAAREQLDGETWGAPGRPGAPRRWRQSWVSFSTWLSCNSGPKSAAAAAKLGIITSAPTSTPAVVEWPGCDAGDRSRCVSDGTPRPPRRSGSGGGREFRAG